MYTFPQKTRPIGITIMAIIVGVQGLFILIAGLQFLGTISIVLGVLSLLLAWGLWTLQPWAFWTAVALEAVDVINDLLALRMGATAVIPSLIFSVLILGYLLREPRVREAFRT